MKHVDACLSGRDDRESSFHSLFKCQRISRKLFSPMWRLCEVGASLFKCGKDLTKPF